MISSGSPPKLMLIQPPLQIITFFERDWDAKNKT